MNKHQPRKETLVGELMHIQAVGVTHALRKSKFPAIFLSRYIYHGANLCFTEVRATTLNVCFPPFFRTQYVFFAGILINTLVTGCFFCETLLHRNLREISRQLSWSLPSTFFHVSKFISRLNLSRKEAVAHGWLFSPGKQALLPEKIIWIFKCNPKQYLSCPFCIVGKRPLEVYLQLLNWKADKQGV